MKVTEQEDVKSAPNILFLFTDQQRADSLGCMGNAVARTPHLDALAARGTLYTRHYATNPLCMPSRASLLTGVLPGVHGVRTNGIGLDRRFPTLADRLSDAGYHTGLVGKLHLSPQLGEGSEESEKRFLSGERDDWRGPLYGFAEAQITTGHGEKCGGHYGRWRSREFPEQELGVDAAPEEGRFPSLLCWRSRLPVEAHPSRWVADRAVEFLDRQSAEQPFFLFASFPDPHNPFTPPEDYAERFSGVDTGEPEGSPNDERPLIWQEAVNGDPFHRDGNARAYPDLTPAVLRACRQHTHAMVNLIDDSVGTILAALERNGQADNTIVVFSADHGDFLGDFGLIRKGPIAAHSLLHVPLIVVDPREATGRCETVCSNVDLVPDLLQRAGINIPDALQGRPLPRVGHPEPERTAYETAWGKFRPEWRHHTLYTADWRITYYPVLRQGELYDLRKDSGERHNRYNDPTLREVRERLHVRLLEAASASHDQPLQAGLKW